MLDERLLRTSLLLGEKAVQHLSQSSVMIVGLGAVGGYALEAIARSGIGKIILVDFDKFDKTNINRQILALENTVGRFKTDVAAERIRQINPNCKIEIVNEFVDSNNISDLLDRAPDYIIDAIDSLEAKCCLIEEIWRRGIPFISSMGAALKTDPTQIREGSLNQTQNCSLAKLIRQKLRKHGVDLGQIPCVWSNEKASIQNDVTCVQGERKPLGSLPTITAIFGLMLANRVILSLSKHI
ncbi:MAG: tRNA threonylcarbamoyladenosine dehydratase [Alphaproteobacteria bacterium]|nr:tRNA threonylcarbamoyladenosine dehydratase [Alphaproteobacteria bacterium]